jgi:hypothetical protein
MRILTTTFLVAWCLIGAAASFAAAQGAPAARVSGDWLGPATESGTPRVLVREYLGNAPNWLGELADWRRGSTGQIQDSEVVLADAAPAAAGGANGTGWGDAESGLVEPKPKPWEVRFAAYGWVPGLDGTIGRGAASSDLDVNYCDVLENLDALECMIPFDFEARYEHIGVFTDLFYIKLEDQVTRDLVTANLEGQQTILEVGLFFRLGTWALSSEGPSSLTADVLGGARYNRLEGNIGLQTPEHAFDIGGVRDWWDPFVGPRLIWQATEQFSLRARGDVGGFGIENCSHLVWQIIASVECDITKNILIELGYRLLDTDFETGSGADHFTYDVLMQGPYLALGVKF